MIQKSNPDSFGNARLQIRGADRRVNKIVSPPPFQTRFGLIEAERRSPFDRRAAWLREYALVVDEPH